MLRSNTQKFVFALTFVCIGFATGYFLGTRQGLKIDITTSELSAVQKLAAAPEADPAQAGEPSTDPMANEDFMKVYRRLGLQNGDTIYKVNDIKTPDGFELLVSAYQQGHVCVHYERDDARRLVCLERDSTGEHVTDVSATD